MARQPYAAVSNGRVVALVEADPTLASFKGLMALGLISASANALPSVGWTWDGTAFAPPPTGDPPVTDQSPVLQARVNVAEGLVTLQARITQGNADLTTLQGIDQTQALSASVVVPILERIVESLLATGQGLSDMLSAQGQ